MSEFDIQCSFTSWLRYHKREIPELESFFAVVNGAGMFAIERKGRRIPIEAMRMKAQGMENGVPDYLGLIPSCGYSGIAIEL